MIRFVLRLLGLLLLALAFILVIYDGMKSIADHAIYLTKLSQVWVEVHATSVQSLERRLPEGVWRFAVQPILEQPASAVFAVLAVVLMLLGRKKRPLIGYARD
jgi:hypothetical protein